MPPGGSTRVTEPSVDVQHLEVQASRLGGLLGCPLELRLGVQSGRFALPVLDLTIDRNRLNQSAPGVVHPCA